MYRLIIKTGLAAFVAVLLILSGQQAFAQESAGKLTTRIDGALLNYYVVSPVKVTVKDPGLVTLQGEVKTLPEKDNVYMIVARVKGVKQVVNDIAVKPAAMLSDGQMQTGIVNNLKFDSVILAPDDIQVSVKDGVATLTGTVNTHLEYKAADFEATYQQGVKQVVNKLTILSAAAKPVQDAQLSAAVKDIIADHFPLDQKTVTVKVENGQVVLSGTVQRLWQKRNLENEVRQVIGVKGVVDQLMVF
jgi:osmotically-inducible protein OsmY